MATLTAETRNALPDSDFALPGRHYPIHDEAHARAALSRGAQNATPEEQATIKRKIKSRYPDIDVDVSKAEWHVPVWKDDARRIVYGVVLAPDIVDSQGDIVKAEEIERAAHRWLTEYRGQDVQHSGVTKNFDGKPIAEPVESFVAPQDFEIAGATVVKGSWVLATHVHDDDTWDRVQKGALGGYSIEGTGVRTPVAA